MRQFLEFSTRHRPEKFIYFKQARVTVFFRKSACRPKKYFPPAKARSFSSNNIFSTTISVTRLRLMTSILHSHRWSTALIRGASGHSNVASALDRPPVPMARVWHLQPLGSYKNRRFSMESFLFVGPAGAECLKRKSILISYLNSLQVGSRMPKILSLSLQMSTP